MKDQVLRYIREHHMLERGDRVITGVSGGADSVCLLFMLKAMKAELDLDLIVVHVEHGLRGEESLEDARFVEHLCKEWGIVCRRYTFDVAAVARERKISTEEAGREVRYESFEAARKECQAARIAVAHNKDDHTETILMNLVRGTGLKGLGGIPAVRGPIIRPLLGVERSDIEQYLEQQGIAYRTDKTNSEDCYTRNKIRLHVLPYLKKEINNKVISHISAGGDIIREADEYIWEEMLKHRTDAVSQTGWGVLIRSEQIAELPVVIQKTLILNELQGAAGTRQDIAGVHVELIRDLLRGRAGRQAFLPYGLIAKRRYDGVEICPVHTDSEQALSAPVQTEVIVNGVTDIPGQPGSICTSVELWNRSEIIPENKCTKWFDYDIIKGNLQLRTRLPGDYFMMEKDRGRKKLKSFFIDEKIPVEERDQILLLAEGSHILWILGFRISAHYKITAQTRRVLKIRYDGGERNG